jgi:hypothetical protein
LLRKAASCGPLDLSISDVAGIASDGKAEQMFGLDRLGATVGRNQCKREQQAGFKRGSAQGG